MTVPHRRSVLALVLVLVAALVAAGCGDDEESAGGTGGGEAGAATQQVELLLPFSESIAFFPLLVARDQGFFEDAGVEVETVVAETGASAVQQLAAGNISYAVTNAENVMIGASRGATIKAISQLDHGIFTIAVPEDSDVQSIEDLEGEEIGLTDAAGGERPLVEAVLEDSGLTPNEDIELPVVGPGGPSVFNALESGDIAAYAGATNDLAAVQAEGVETRSVLPEKFQDLPANFIVVTEEVLADEAQREAALGLARAWNQGIAFAEENPQQALDIACEQVPEECEDRASAQAFFDVQLEAATPLEGQPYGAPSYDRLETILDTLVRDAVAQEVDLQAVFTDEYVDEIQPDEGQ